MAASKEVCNQTLFAKLLLAEIIFMGLMIKIFEKFVNQWSLYKVFILQ